MLVADGRRPLWPSLSDAVVILPHHGRNESTKRIVPLAPMTNSGLVARVPVVRVPVLFTPTYATSPPSGRRRSFLVPSRSDALRTSPLTLAPKRRRRVIPAIVETIAVRATIDRRTIDLAAGAAELFPCDR